MVRDIKKAITFSERQKELDDPDSLKTLFAGLNRTAAIKKRASELSATTEGASLVKEEISILFSIFESKISELHGEQVPLPITRPPPPQPEFFYYGLWSSDSGGECPENANS